MVCKAFENESMEDHIIKGLELINLWIKRNYGQKIATLFQLNDKLIGELILTSAYIFHDIGKGLTIYSKGKSYWGHEYYSAYLYNECFNLEPLISQITFNQAYSLKEVEEGIKIAGALAISLHHHTMKNRYNKIRHSEGETFQVSENCWKLYEQIMKPDLLNHYLSEKDPRITRALFRKIDNFNGKECKEYSEKCLEAFSSLPLIKPPTTYLKTNLLQKVYSLLYPIMIADNFAATLNRGKHPFSAYKDNENINSIGSVLGRDAMKYIITINSQLE
ncbi:MAG: hypothetical protein GF308_20595 [Candidatus Heimdallarchaeota archaeon]|nr:hypothetical protein [Candidatus Heimdallarchaeota archaeon]